MRCPTLAELPPPPAGKTGWPWTEETPQLFGVMPDGNEWPQVSIVTPSYNQGQYLEETIRSVLLQGYPNLQYIIIDGGSTDNSVDIIRKYEPWLDYWVSEKDRGQSDAINKGWSRSSGDIIAWLNSDDTYCQNAITTQITYLSQHKSIDVVYSDCLYTVDDARPSMIGYGRPFTVVELLRFTIPYQPTVFMRKHALTQAGMLDQNFHYSMDSEYWLRLASRDLNFAYNPYLIATYRLHDSSKTVSNIVKMHADWRRLIEMYAPPSLLTTILADFHLQVAMHLIEQRNVQESLQHAAYGYSIRPKKRVLAYLVLLLDYSLGTSLYKRLLQMWMGLRRYA